MNAATRFRVGEWIATPSLNAIEREGTVVRLEPRSMDVLVALAARPGEVVSIEELMRTVWKQVVVSDSSVYLAISQLRQAFAGDPGLIETVPKRGYRLTAPVTRPEAQAQEPAAAVTDTAERASAWRWVGAAIVLASAAAGVWIAQLLQGPITVAVLPFESLSDDPQQAYFADGVTVEVLNTLSRVEGLRVIGQTSAFRLRGEASDAPATARKLGARFVLSGSVRRSGDDLRIVAQLEDASSGTMVWSGKFERSFADIFRIQDEIASAVANALQIRLGVGELGRTPGMTQDVGAYDEFLRANAENLRATESAYDAAIAHMQRAVAIDPSFALAWAELTTICGNAAVAYPTRAAEWRRIAVDALARANALAPDEPPVLLATAIDQLRQGQWRAAARSYERLDSAYRRYGLDEQASAPRGIFLLAVGRAREAIPHLERARANEPLAPAFAGFLGTAQLAAGNPRAALAEADRGLAMEGLDTQMLNLAVDAALNLRDPAEIRTRVAALAARVPAAPAARLVSMLDDPEAGVAAIGEIAETAGTRDKLPLADWAAYFGAPDLAVRLLVESRPNLARPGLLWEPLLSDVRQREEFKGLLRRSGIVDYWRSEQWPEMCRPTTGEDFRCQ